MPYNPYLLDQPDYVDPYAQDGSLERQMFDYQGTDIPDTYQADQLPASPATTPAAPVDEPQWPDTTGDTPTDQPPPPATTAPAPPAPAPTSPYVAPPTGGTGQFGVPANGMPTTNPAGFAYMEGVDSGKMADSSVLTPKYIASRILASGGTIQQAAAAIGATVLDETRMRLPTGETIDTRRDEEGANALQWLVIGGG